MSAKTRERQLRKIKACRKDVEEAFSVLNRSMERELSFMPQGRRWLLPTVAFAVGIVLSGAGRQESASLDTRQKTGDS